MTSDQSDISGYLDSLRREGQYESSGSFSLASKEALEKLKNFQLHSKEQYILHLVSAAVRRNATQIQFDIRANDLRMAFDGDPFSQSELEDLFSSFFRVDPSPQNQSRKDLAIALNTITTFNPDFVVLESWKGKQGSVLQLYEDKVWHESLTANSPRPDKSSFQYLCFQTPLNFINYCLPSLVMAGRKEPQLLKERCCYGPARIWLNNSLVSGPRAALTVKFSCPGKVFPNMPVPNDCPTIDGPNAGYMLVKSWSNTASRLLFVVGGVSFEQKAPGSLFPPSSLTVIYADHLKKDLSNLALVDNEELQLVHQQAAQQVLTAIASVCNNSLRVAGQLQDWYHQRLGSQRNEVNHR